MEERLRIALRRLGYDDAEVQLESAGGGMVGGVLVSEKFVGLSQEDRQKQLWDGLQHQLQADDLTQIVAIMTMTPQEIAA